MLDIEKQTSIIDSLKSLSELELAPILEELKAHLYNNSMGHLIEDADLVGRIEELEDELAEANANISELELREPEPLEYTEDVLANHLSSLSPIDYESLITKVNRSKWVAMGHMGLKQRKS